MIGLNKKMDKRIKILEEIMYFSMKGVELDNGDMYVEGNKDDYEVSDEFVYVNEKLMDELEK